MKGCIPLERPLYTLTPAQPVWVVRNGYALQYPREILRDIADDRYALLAASCSFSTRAQAEGERLTRWAEQVGDDAASLQAGLANAWRRARGHIDRAFDVWLDSVNLDADPRWLGMGAYLAATTMTTAAAFHAARVADSIADV